MIENGLFTDSLFCVLVFRSFCAVCFLSSGIDATRQLYGYQLTCDGCVTLAFPNVSRWCDIFQQGNPFQSAVFNKTIRVLEPDEGLDGETYGAVISLLTVVGVPLIVSSLLLLLLPFSCVRCWLWIIVAVWNGLSSD